MSPGSQPDGGPGSSGELLPEVMTNCGNSRERVSPANVSRIRRCRPRHSSTRRTCGWPATARRGSGIGADISSPPPPWPCVASSSSAPATISVSSTARAPNASIWTARSCAPTRAALVMAPFAMALPPELTRSQGQLVSLRYVAGGSQNGCRRRPVRRETPTPPPGPHPVRSSVGAPRDPPGPRGAPTVQPGRASAGFGCARSAPAAWRRARRPRPPTRSNVRERFPPGCAGSRDAGPLRSRSCARSRSSTADARAPVARAPAVADGRRVAAPTRAARRSITPRRFASASSRFIAAIGLDPRSRSSTLNTGAVCATLDAHQASVAALAFSDGRIVAAWEDGRVETLDIPLAV